MRKCSFCDNESIPDSIVCKTCRHECTSSNPDNDMGCVVACCFLALVLAGFSNKLYTIFKQFTGYINEL
jgi:hypothetical protein